MKKFSREELQKYYGSRGISYVAYRGKVYDVSKSFHWKRGVHQVLHKAGQDLTDALEDAPHTTTLLFRFPVVGELEAEENR
jgi:predicted heme/steroid binding protein